MQRIITLIRRNTRELDGVISTHLDRLEDFDYDQQAYILIEVESDHPVLRDRQVYYREENGVIVRKSQAEIDQILADEAIPPPSRGPSASELLLILVNELRAKNGDPPVTLEEVRNRTRG